MITCFCYGNLVNSGKIRNFAPFPLRKQIVGSLISSKVDYSDPSVYTIIHDASKTSPEGTVCSHILCYQSVCKRYRRYLEVRMASDRTEKRPQPPKTDFQGLEFG